MKTLYVNISNKPALKSEELVVLDYDLIGDFFFYLGDRIAEGCDVLNENSLISDFNTSENKEDFDSILSQWCEIKTLLFGDDVSGTFDFELPTGYLLWLRYNEKFSHVYEKNFSKGRKSVRVDLEKLYADTIEDLQRKILRKLKRDDLYLDIDEIVFGDKDVTRKSAIVQYIKKYYGNFGFKSYKKWLQDNNESTNNGFTFNSFFPVCGITLNETTIQDVGRKVHNCDEIEYKDDGTVYVWINNGKSGALGSVISKENNSIYFTSIYMTREDLMFWEWRNLGFDWNLKYKDWVSLFKNMEFTLIQTDPYKSQCEGTPNNYDAGIIAISKDGLLKFHLEFTSDRNYVKHSRLYSISAYSKDYCCDVDSVRETFYNLEDVYCKKKKYL